MAKRKQTPAPTKKSSAPPSDPSKDAGGAGGSGMAKKMKARAQKAAGGSDKGDGAPAHASKKRKAAPEDPATKDADQAVQPARKKKKKQKAKKKEQPQPQKQKQKAKQKPSKANAQQLQVPAGSGGVLNAGAASSSSQTLSVDSSVLGTGALQPNKAAAAAAGRHKRTFAVQGRRGGKDTASGAVIVTQRRTVTAVTPPAPCHASRHLEAGKTFFCLDTNALVGGSSDVQQAWAAIQAAGGGSVQLMVPLKVVYEVKAGRNHLVEGRPRQPFSHASSLLNALIGSHSCCRVQRDEEVYRGHPKGIANQKVDSAILDCLLYFTSLNATVVLCTNSVKFAEHAAQHNVRTITHSELPSAVVKTLQGAGRLPAAATPGDAVPGAPGTVLPVSMQAAVQPATQLMAEMQRLADTQLQVALQLSVMAEHLAATQRPPAAATLQAGGSAVLQAPEPCSQFPPAQSPPLIRPPLPLLIAPLMPPHWNQQPFGGAAVRSHSQIFTPLPPPPPPLHLRQQPGPPTTQGGSCLLPPPRVN